MGNVFTTANIKKGLIYNGQLDTKTTSELSFQNTVNTYRGNIGETCLKDRKN